MNPGIIALLIVIGVILLFAIIVVVWWISVYNKFRRYQVAVEEAKSGIDVALTKRFDLLTKMFDITKGYAKHEHDTLADVIGLRTGIPAGTSVKDLSDINGKLDAEQKKIDIVFEKYPDLKANTVFIELQASSRDAEEHLQASRRLYNSNVKVYNELLLVFPSSIIAHHYHFEKADFFEAEEAKRSDVKMEF
jgi:LemA protein